MKALLILSFVQTCRQNRTRQVFWVVPLRILLLPYCVSTNKHCISLSACLLQRQSVDYARVQTYSLQVLHWRPGDVKALYRAGVATLELGDARTAKEYLVQACRAQPNGEKEGPTTTSHSLEECDVSAEKRVIWNPFDTCFFDG